MDDFVIDAFEFCRLKEHRSGEMPVADLSRLTAETVDSSGSLQWSLQGGANQHGHPQLTLSVAGKVKLKCQRCLQSLEQEIDSASILVLAQDEASADEMEALLADEDVEVVVGSRALDLRQMIEDEALLALPLSPRHEICPDQGALSALKEEKKDSPFSVLKNLKK
jgi:uncharacterized protein